MIAKVSDKINVLFNNNSSLKSIFIGGVQPTIMDFELKNSCTPEVKAKLEKYVTTAYTNSYGLEELLLKNKRLHETYLEKYVKEKNEYLQIVKKMGARKVISLNQSLGYPIKIKKIYYVAGNKIGATFCKDCEVIYKKDKCIHKHHIPLEQWHQKFEFSPGTYGDVVSKHQLLVQI